MASLGIGVALRQIHQLCSVGVVASLPDTRLLDRFAQGRDEAAFAALVERHGPMVLGVCRAVLKDEHAAEDAFQATFLVLAKKAGTIRAGETLAAWLCRVAFRIAVQAGRQADRRRRREARAMVIARRDEDGPGPDVLLALHEELDGLPDRLRVPVVLCHLEGKTYDEAAKTLRVPPATIRGRLVRARERLAVRLTRRGVSGAMIAAVLSSRSARAAVPASLAQSTIRAATAGTASAAAAGLASGYLSVLAATKALSFVAVFSIAAGASFLLGGAKPGEAATLARSATAVESPRPSASPPQSAGPENRPPAEIVRKEDESVEISGRVLGPDGRPVSGAAVKSSFTLRTKHDPVEAVSDSDGRFRLRIGRSLREALHGAKSVSPQSIVASARGFGAASSKLDPSGLGEVTIRLSEDGPPIEGRILDLEGRPVAAATVRVERLWIADGGDLTPWAESVKAGEARTVWGNLKLLAASLSTTSGADGRFRLEGIGRERLAELSVSGPTVATDRFYATNHPGPDSDLRLVREDLRGTKTIVIHAASSDFAVGPTKVIEGVIRDKDTGKPIAGVAVQGAPYDPQSLIWNQDVHAISDAEGRYRLSGLARSGSYRLFVRPGEGVPYARAMLKVAADSPALAPVTFDVSLKRGVLVTGRLLDKATGKPVRIERVNVASFADNPNVADYPGYKDGDMTYGIPDGEGGFEVVALPGRGLLGVRADTYGYLKPSGVEKIAGYDPKYQSFATAVPHMIPVVNFHAVVETNFPPGTEAATLDLVADPGRSVTLSIVDPDGKPLAGTTVNGAGGVLGSYKGVDQATHEIEVKALAPREPRRVTVRHDGRKLVGSVVLKGDEPGPVTLKLQPWAELRGRIVDDEGQPRPKLALSTGGRSKRPFEELAILPGADLGGGIAPDKEGRFRVVGLVPGLYYAADAEEKGYLHIGHLFDEVRLSPGEVKDLGDLKVIPYKEDDNQ